VSRDVDIRLIGPGGAGKSTIGAVLAKSLQIPFVDLDSHLTARVGDISSYMARHGYDEYARANIETYSSILRETSPCRVLALSSGFMSYAPDVHVEYSHLRRELERHPFAFILLPSLHRDRCIAETVRRQIARPFGRSAAEEEAVIRARFDSYATLPMRKIDTMRPISTVVDDILTALAVEKP
jgi:shikimate kinase